MGPGGPMGGPRPMMGRRPPGGGRRRGAPDGMPPPPFGKPSEKADDFAEENFDMKQMEKECEEMLKVKLLNKSNSHFVKTDGGSIDLTFEQNDWENISIIRTFPFTKPDSCLSVREGSGKKREIGMIQCLTEDFDEDTVRIINEHLKLRYFMPIIKKILSIKESNGYVNFKVQTDHGEASFSLQSNGNHFTTLSDTRILITDLEGNRYEIPDTGKLSSKELKKLDLYL